MPAARTPCSCRSSNGGLAQRRSQAGQGQRGTRRPRGRWGRAAQKRSLAAASGRRGAVRSSLREQRSRQKLPAAQYWCMGGVDDELVYVFARCCCRPPWGAAAGDLLDHVLELPQSATCATSCCRRPFRVRDGKPPQKASPVSCLSSMHSLLENWLFLSC
jgi:hypothetical protein